MYGMGVQPTAHLTIWESLAIWRLAQGEQRFTLYQEGSTVQSAAEFPPHHDRVTEAAGAKAVWVKRGGASYTALGNVGIYNPTTARTYL